MNSKLEKMLTKNMLLYDILLLVKYRHDKEFLEKIKDVRKNANLVELQENSCGTEKSGILCDIEIEGENEGFFALVRWTLDALYFCDCFSLYPYIRFSSKNLYYDNTLSGERNTFEYFFEQPINKDLSNYITIIKYNSRNRLKAEFLNGGVSYRVTEMYIDEMARIMRKYLRFNNEIKQIIDEELKKNRISEKTLGVHIRGTDYKSNYKNHPCYVAPNEYYKYINEAFSIYDFEKIYIATDDEDILKVFIEKYGIKKVVFAENTVRSRGVEGVHTSPGNREHHKYMLGVEVICDMCMLASCGGVISGMSQVGLMSRIYKKSKEGSFLYDKTIDKGLNSKGKIFKVKKD